MTCVTYVNVNDMRDMPHSPKAEIVCVPCFGHEIHYRSLFAKEPYQREQERLLLSFIGLFCRKRPILLQKETYNGIACVSGFVHERQGVCVCVCVCVCGFVAEAHVRHASFTKG